VIGREGPAVVRLALALVLGIAVGVLVETLAGWRYAAPSGWAATALVFTVWTWAVLGPMDPNETATHATREDPTRAYADIIVVLASLASLIGVVSVLLASSHPVATTAVGVASIAGAWFMVHSVYALRYARLYYGDVPGGIDFNQPDPPQYTDFAYVAFTVGMSFAISDTNVQSHTIRATVLRHALVSYLFGAVIVAVVINLVASLGG